MTADDLMTCWLGCRHPTKCSKGTRTEHCGGMMHFPIRGKMRKPVVHKAVADWLNHSSFALVVFQICLLAYHYRWRNSAMMRRTRSSEVEKMYAWTYINATIWQQSFQSKWNYWNYAIYPLLFLLFWLVTFCHVYCEPEHFYHLWGMQVFSLLEYIFCSWKRKFQQRRIHLLTYIYFSANTKFGLWTNDTKRLNARKLDRSFYVNECCQVSARF